MEDTPVIIWKDAFVVVAGLDEERERFYYSDGSDRSLKELPFADFGMNRSPYWYVQVFEHQIEMDVLQIVKESFVQAVNKYENHELLLPEDCYACGSLVYDAIIEAFQIRNYDPSGAWEIIKALAAAKQDIRYYTRTIAQLEPVCRRLLSRAVADNLPYGGIGPAREPV